MRVLGFLALRGLLATRRTFALLVVAISVGVGFQIPNTANLAGSSATLLEEGLVWGAGDVRVEPSDRARFADGDALAARIASLVQGRSVPVIVLAGAVGVGGRFVAAPVLGVDSLARNVRITHGAPLAAGDRDGIVVGSELARKLGVAIGDSVELRAIFSPPEAAVLSDDIGAYTLTVRGISAGSGGTYRVAIVDRQFLAEQLGEPRAASAIYVHLADHDDAPAIAAALPIAIAGLRAVDWRTDDPMLRMLLRANATIDRVSYGMVIAAITVPLLALLYIRVVRRRREIAILATLGFLRRELFAIYVVQSLVVALAGAAVGAGVGYAAISYFRRSPVFSWEGMTVTPLANAATFLVPMSVAMTAALAAGAFAAWRAARTDPARTLQRFG